jgi:hypothetical protein
VLADAEAACSGGVGALSGDEVADSSPPSTVGWVGGCGIGLSGGAATVEVART